MALSFDNKIIGYGAWNLHFDKKLGAEPSTDNLTFLSFLRAWGYFKINHIKIVLFRNSTLEGLPAGRALPLYVGGAINQLLIDNLKRLVEEAAAKGFWVQICIWNYHALKFREEYPENAPAKLAPDWTADVGTRLAKYYAPTAANEGAFELHRKLFEKIGKEFGSYSNVLFELGNELRVWENAGGDHAKDERNLRSWLTSMLETLRTSASPNQIRVCTSTGVSNQDILLAPPKGVAVDFYDFHAGQWNMTLKTDTGYKAGIAQSRADVNRYKPGAKLLIDADGLFGPESFATAQVFSTFLEKWAKEAFLKGESFITKGYYPPKFNISRPMLDALELAARDESET